MDQQNTNEGIVNIESLRTYILIGQQPDGKIVEAMSTGLSLPDASMLVARLQFNLQMQTNIAAMYQFRQQMAEEKPTILKPQMNVISRRG